MKIRFLRDCVVRDEHEGTEKQTAYKAGQSISVPESSARHWINRGVAETVAMSQRQQKKPAVVESAE